MATVVTVKVISIDAHDVAAGVKVGDIFNAFMEFNHDVHYFVAYLKDGKRHHLLSSQVEAVDKTLL